MSLETVQSIGYGGGFLNTKLPRILTELQGLTISGPLTGAAAATPIVVAEGIDSQDTILKALMFAAGVPSDITSTASIVSNNATATITFGAGFAAGEVLTVNGRVYTAVAGVPNPTYNPTSVPGTFIDGVAIMALTTATQQSVALQAMGFSAATAATLIAGGSLAIAAASFAKTVAANDSFNLAATASGAVATLTWLAEGTAGNAVTLGVNSAHTTRSGATFTGGRQSLPSGTVTTVGSAVGDTITVDGKVYTAVASGTQLAYNQFIGGVVSQADLLNVGFSEAVANALLAVSNDAAVATILAHQINGADGSAITAIPGNMPVEEGLPLTPLTNITVAQAALASNIITVTSDHDIPLAANLPTLAISAHGSVSGATLTASNRAVQFTGSTAGNTVLLFWYKKSRVVGQA